MKILGLFAHPDDAEIWAGGTFIKHRLAEDEVWTATFPDRDPQRIAEAIAGAQILGVVPRFLTSSLDRGTFLEHRQEVQALLEEIQPTILVTHWYGDTHPHHRLVFDATNQAIIPIKIANGLPKALFVCDTYHSVGLISTFQPSCYIDVSDVWEQKLQAIDAHTSQSPSLWKEMISNQARLYGARIGRAFAEGFLEMPILGRFRPSERLFA